MGANTGREKAHTNTAPWTCENLDSRRSSSPDTEPLHYTIMAGECQPCMHQQAPHLPLHPASGCWCPRPAPVWCCHMTCLHPCLPPVPPLPWGLLSQLGLVVAERCPAPAASPSQVSSPLWAEGWWAGRALHHLDSPTAIPHHRTQQENFCGVTCGCKYLGAGSGVLQGCCMRGGMGCTMLDTASSNRL